MFGVSRLSSPWHGRAGSLGSVESSLIRCSAGTPIIDRVHRYIDQLGRGHQLASRDRSSARVSGRRDSGIQESLDLLSVHGRVCFAEIDERTKILWIEGEEAQDVRA